MDHSLSSLSQIDKLFDVTVGNWIAPRLFDFNVGVEASFPQHWSKLNVIEKKKVSGIDWTAV